MKKTVIQSLILLTLVFLNACNLPTQPQVDPVDATPVLPPTGTAIPTLAQNTATTLPEDTATPLPETEPSPTLEEEATPVEEATPAAETATPTTAPTEVDQLYTTGPWLVFDTQQGLAATNYDGTFPVLLLAGLAVPQSGLAASPEGRWLAFLTGDSSGFPPPDISLALAPFPEGSVSRVTPLLSSTLQDEVRNPPEPMSGSEALRAVSNSDILAWSPDGSMIAFVAALDGPSSDLYVMNMEDRRLTRLTDGPGETATPFWSPDGRWIVHQAVQNFGTGAGWSGITVWAAASDDGGVKKLYDATQSGSEIFLGWSAPDTFIVNTWTAGGLTNIRSVNVTTGASQTIFNGRFDSAALDPGTGTLAISVDEFLAELEGQDAGLYLIAPVGQPTLVEAGDAQEVRWSAEGQRFIAVVDDNAVVFSPTGEKAVLSGLQNVALSPDGQRVAAWGHAQFDPEAGVRIFGIDGQLQAEVSQASTDVVVWRPDSAGLFFVAEEGLYYASLEGEARLIHEGVTAGFFGGMEWAPGAE